MPDLRETPNGWAEVPPAECANGHLLGPGRVQVGHQACGGHNGSHRTYFCLECQDVTYRPALGAACRVLHGPAGIRNL